MRYSLEGEIEPKGRLVRVRLRLCRGIYVIDSYRHTFDLSTPIGSALRCMREFLPREFRDDPQIKAALFDPIEEIWAHRVKFHYLGSLM